MSFVPILFRDWWDDCWDTPLRTSRILDQHFGSGISADDLLTALTTTAAEQSAVRNQRRSRYSPPRYSPRYSRPWRSFRQDSGSMVNVGSDKFQINLDVQQFSPEEISVKTTDNNVIVEAKHEEKQDEHGYVSRHFVRRYMLPDGHDLDKMESLLSSDGILTVRVPKKALPEPEGLKTIQIVQTGQPMKKLMEKGEAQAIGKATKAA